MECKATVIKVNVQIIQGVPKLASKLHTVKFLVGSPKKNAKRTVSVRSVVYQKSTRKKSMTSQPFWTHQQQIFKKADVQSVHRTYRGRFEGAVDGMSANGATEGCPLKYRSHADEQLSPFV
ncbi:hypothetical protein TNCV_1654791 [Trichonephila clavipes]|nr:hypothetical protein TNCV_1654791 [Trichonephila clavipes]